MIVMLRRFCEIGFENEIFSYEQKQQLQQKNESDSETDRQDMTYKVNHERQDDKRE